jgi:metallo-beta-lactamase class B
MNSRAIGIATALAITAGAGLVLAQAPAPAPTTVDGLVSAAKVAAGTDWSGTFMRLCIPPPPSTGRGAGAGAGAGAAAGAGRTGAAGGAAAAGRAGRAAAPAANAPNAGPPRSTWYAQPAKVADNFYFLGTKIHSAWALVGSDGIIVLEALFDYAAPDEVVGGLKKFGLDASKVKYIVISHAHSDHDGGAKFLQDSMPNAHLVYGAADWDAVDKAATHQGGKPKHDMVGADGMKLSVGDASIQLVATPGHTPGTLSFLFELKDNGKPLKVAYVGGTAIPFNGTAEYYDEYIASARKMKKAAADFGATAFMSNHSEFDDAYFKAHTAASRNPGEENPFEVGSAAVGRYSTVVEDCAMAAKLRATGKL